MIAGAKPMVISGRRVSSKNGGELRPQVRAEDQKADRSGGCGGDQDCRRANVLAHTCEWVHLWTGQIDDCFQRGIDEFTEPDHADRQDEKRPFDQREFQPDSHRHTGHRGNGVQPGVALGSDDVPPSRESIAEGIQS